MAKIDFELEVLAEGIVIRHRDGHVLSYFRPDEPSDGLVEHMRYCDPRCEASFASFVEQAQCAAHEAASKEGWLEA
jgi:hypothetical protein